MTAEDIQKVEIIPTHHQVVRVLMVVPADLVDDLAKMVMVVVLRGIHEQCQEIFPVEVAAVLIQVAVPTEQMASFE
jgi:hypothetical protein